MRHRRQGNWLTTALGTILLLVIGTVIGRDLRLGPLSQSIGFAPLTLNLYVATLAIGIETNVLGLIGALAGLLLLRFA